MANGKLGYRFYAWYAWTNLTEISARVSTIAVIGTVTGVVTLTLLLLGLTRGYSRAQELQYKDNPVALCLYAGSSLIPDEITDEVLEKLQTELARQAPGAVISPLERCGLFFEIDATKQQTPEEGRVFKGRTALAGDPLLRGYNIDETTFEQFGIFVTPGFLEGYYLEESDSLQPPAKLKLHAEKNRNVTIDVPVLGVTSFDLPEGFEFVICEAHLDRLENLRAPTRLITGGIPLQHHDWRRWTDEQKQALRDFLMSRGLMTDPGVLVDIDPKKQTWELRSASEDGLQEEQWNKIIAELKTTLGAMMIDVHEVFIRNAQAKPAEFETKPTIYDSVGVIPATPSQLRTIKNLLESLNLRQDNQVADRLIAISQITNTLSALLAGLALMVMLFSGLNIYTILSQRAHHQRADFGMLKAIGMTAEQQSALSLTEGGFLWLAAAASAVALTFVLGFGTQVIWNLTAGRVMVAFDCTWWVWLITLLTSGLICLVCSHLATAESRRDTPLRLLSTAG